MISKKQNGRFTKLQAIEDNHRVSQHLEDTGQDVDRF